jgi:hypothetical protein
MMRLPAYVTPQQIATAKDTLDPVHKVLSKGIAFFEYQVTFQVFDGFKRGNISPFNNNVRSDENFSNQV